MSQVIMSGRILDRHVGGNSTYALNLADGLRRRGWRVGSMPFARHPLATAILETQVGLRRGSPDEILHYLADTGALMRTRRPAVTTVHGVASLYVPTARQPAASRVWMARVSRAIVSSDHIITVSDSSRRDIQRVWGVPDDRITTIHHGVAQSAFAAAEGDDDRPLFDGAPYVLYLGNIEPRKNLLPLIEAFRRPTLTRSGVRLVIAGRPAWDYEDVMSAITASPNVTHLGFVSDEDRRRLMQGCQLFVFPSLYEGFGFPVLEALASRAVVVSSSCGSLGEVAGPALRFEQLDALGIEAGVLAGLTDTEARARCVAEGPGWVSRFSWDKSVEAHIEVYRRVLDRGVR